jgi:hypothetical protein
MRRKSIIQKFSICAALIFAILASGCVIGPNTIGPTTWTYSGEPIRLPKSEVAVIKGYWYLHLFGYGGVDIYSLDGNLLEATKVEVSPGWHELVIREYVFSLAAIGPNPPAYTRGAFNFETGHEYKIKNPLFTGCKIVDVTTGAVILKFPPFKDRCEFFGRNRPPYSIWED